MCVSRQSVNVRAGSRQRPAPYQQQRPPGKCCDFPPPATRRSIHKCAVHANEGPRIPLALLAALLLAATNVLVVVSMTAPDIDGVQISGASASATAKAGSVVTGSDVLRRVPRSPAKTSTTARPAIYVHFITGSASKDCFWMFGNSFVNHNLVRTIKKMVVKGGAEKRLHGLGAELMMLFASFKPLPKKQIYAACPDNHRKVLER
uniref:Uncharacterized protein n=1 Tax=Anopheles atroparvus TaxID=41427 RepID=A0A182IN37_ANOAO